MLRHAGEIVVCPGCGNRDRWAGIVQEEDGMQATCMSCGRTVQRGRTDATTTVTSSSHDNMTVTQTVGPRSDRNRGAAARTRAARRLRDAADALAELAELGIDDDAATFAQEAELLRGQASDLERR